MRFLPYFAVLLAACSGARPLLTSDALEAERRQSEQVLQRAAKERGAEVTESGSVVRVLEAGQGARPQASDTVTIRYRTSLRDGRVIESTESRPVAPTVVLELLNPCFAAGVQRMHVGGRSRVTCKSELVYGNRAVRGVVPGSVVLVDLELVGVGQPLPPPGH